MIRNFAALALSLGTIAVGSGSHAAPLVFDVSGTGSANTVSAFAPSPYGVFSTAFSPGSSVSVETDTNGDTVPGDVSLLGGTLYVDGTSDFGAIGAIQTNAVVLMSGGGGTLLGDDIVWSSPTSFVTTGTFRCSGSICSIWGLTPGVDYPLSYLAPLIGIVPLTDPVDLGRWDLDATLATILGSTRAVSALGGPTPPPGAGNPSQWYLFGSNDLGFAVPEPGVFALVLFGLTALASRRYRSV